MTREREDVYINNVKIAEIWRVRPTNWGGVFWLGLIVLTFGIFFLVRLLWQLWKYGSSDQHGARTVTRDVVQPNGTVLRQNLYIPGYIGRFWVSLALTYFFPGIASLLTLAWWRQAETFAAQTGHIPTGTTHMRRLFWGSLLVYAGLIVAFVAAVAVAG